MQIPRKFSSDKLMWNLIWIVIHFYVFNKTLLTFLHNFIFDKLVRFALDSLEVLFVKSLKTNQRWKTVSRVAKCDKFSHVCILTTFIYAYQPMMSKHVQSQHLKHWSKHQISSLQNRSSSVMQAGSNFFIFNFEQILLCMLGFVMLIY